jgi:hypothetical protein
MLDLRAYVTPKVGERVVFPDDGGAGEVVEVVRQTHTDDLLRVAWDNDPQGADQDLYSWAVLSRDVTA